MRRDSILAGLLFITPLTVWSADPEASVSGQELESAPEVIDQIVVVAHKGERSVHDIAANVSVFSRETIEGQLATSISDVFRYAPGIDAETSGARFGT